VFKGNLLHTQLLTGGKTKDQYNKMIAKNQKKSSGDGFDTILSRKMCILIAYEYFAFPYDYIILSFPHRKKTEVIYAAKKPGRYQDT